MKNVPGGPPTSYTSAPSHPPPRNNDAAASPPPSVVESCTASDRRCSRLSTSALFVAAGWKDRGSHAAAKQEVCFPGKGTAPTTLPCSTPSEASLAPRSVSSRALKASTIPADGSAEMAAALQAGGRFQRLVGILFMLGSAVFFGLASLFVRLATDRGVAALHVVAWRGIMQFIFGLVGCLFVAKVNPLGEKDLRPLMVLRGTLGALGLSLFYISVSRLPLGDANALFFTSPFFATLIAWCWIGETVPAYMLLVGAVSFVGVVFVSRPTFIFPPDGESAHHLLSGALLSSESGVGVGGSLRRLIAAMMVVTRGSPAVNNISELDGLAAAPAPDSGIKSVQVPLPQAATVWSEGHFYYSCVCLIAAAIGGGALTTVRRIGPRAVPMQLVFYFGLVASCFSIPWALMTHHAAADFQVYRDPMAVSHILCVGLTASIAQVFLNTGLQKEKVGIGGLIRNLDVVLAFVMQAVVLNESATRSSVIGAVLIIGSSFTVAIGKLCGLGGDGGDLSRPTSSTSTEDAANNCSGNGAIELPVTSSSKNSSRPLTPSLLDVGEIYDNEESAEEDIVGKDRDSLVGGSAETRNRRDSRAVGSVSALSVGSGSAYDEDYVDDEDDENEDDENEALDSVIVVGGLGACRWGGR